MFHNIHSSRCGRPCLTPHWPGLAMPRQPDAAFSKAHLYLDKSLMFEGLLSVAFTEKFRVAAEGGSATCDWEAELIL